MFSRPSFYPLGEILQVPPHSPSETRSSTTTNNANKAGVNYDTDEVVVVAQGKANEKTPAYYKFANGVELQAWRSQGGRGRHSLETKKLIDHYSPLIEFIGQFVETHGPNPALQLIQTSLAGAAGGAAAAVQAPTPLTLSTSSGGGSGASGAITMTTSEADAAFERQLALQTQINTLNDEIAELNKVANARDHEFVNVLNHKKAVEAHNAHLKAEKHSAEEEIARLRAVGLALQNQKLQLEEEKRRLQEEAQDSQVAALSASAAAASSAAASASAAQVVSLEAKVCELNGIISQLQEHLRNVVADNAKNSEERASLSAKRISTLANEKINEAKKLNMKLAVALSQRNTIITDLTERLEQTESKLAIVKNVFESLDEVSADADDNEVEQYIASPVIASPFVAVEQARAAVVAAPVPFVPQPQEVAQQDDDESEAPVGEVHNAIVLDDDNNFGDANDMPLVTTTPPESPATPPPAPKAPKKNGKRAFVDISSSPNTPGTPSKRLASLRAKNQVPQPSPKKAKTAKKITFSNDDDNHNHIVGDAPAFFIMPHPDKANIDRAEYDRVVEILTNTLKWIEVGDFEAVTNDKEVRIVISAASGQAPPHSFGTFIPEFASIADNARALFSVGARCISITDLIDVIAESDYTDEELHSVILARCVEARTRQEIRATRLQLKSGVMPGPLCDKAWQAIQGLMPSKRDATETIVIKNDEHLMKVLLKLCKFTESDE